MIQQEKKPHLLRATYCHERFEYLHDDTSNPRTKLCNDFVTICQVLEVGAFAIFSLVVSYGLACTLHCPVIVKSCFGIAQLGVGRIELC